MTSRSSIDFNGPMLQRICAEYLEMPGLQVTLEQAQRLWGLEEETVRAHLEYLVENRFLVRTGRNRYARSTEGSIAIPARRMAKASLDRSHAVRLDRAGVEGA
jgi:hypothetical protein